MVVLKAEDGSMQRMLWSDEDVHLSPAFVLSSPPEMMFTLKSLRLQKHPKIPLLSLLQLR